MARCPVCDAQGIDDLDRHIDEEHGFGVNAPIKQELASAAAPTLTVIALCSGVIAAGWLGVLIGGGLADATARNCGFFTGCEVPGEVYFLALLSLVLTLAATILSAKWPRDWLWSMFACSAITFFVSVLVLLFASDQAVAKFLGAELGTTARANDRLVLGGMLFPPALLLSAGGACLAWRTNGRSGLGVPAVILGVQVLVAAVVLPVTSRLEGSRESQRVEFLERSGVSTVHKFAGNGAFLLRWDLRGESSYPWANRLIAVGPSGRVYATYQKDFVDVEVQVFSSLGDHLNGWKLPRPRGTTSAGKSPLAIAVSPTGEVYLLVQGAEETPPRAPYSTGVYYLQVFASDGSLIGEWTHWSDKSQWESGTGNPTSIAIGSGGDVYVAIRRWSPNGPIVKWIEVYSPSGMLLAKWDVGACAGGESGARGRGDESPPFDDILYDIALDQNDRVYVTNYKYGYGCVQVLSGEGAPVTEWPMPKQPSQPLGIAVDRWGGVYVVDKLQSKVLKYSGRGTLQATWGSIGPGKGEFTSVSDIAADSDGNIYVK